MIRETEDEVNVNNEIGQCLKEIIPYLPEKYKNAYINKVPKDDPEGTLGFISA
ncbi:MAG: hypothetical protein AAGU27_17055 [Dehalobacterium sp.]